jgi:hypothetical protein
VVDGLSALRFRRRDRGKPQTVELSRARSPSCSERDRSRGAILRPALGDEVYRCEVHDALLSFDVALQR